MWRNKGPQYLNVINALERRLKCLKLVRYRPSNCATIFALPYPAAKPKLSTFSYPSQRQPKPSFLARVDKQTWAVRQHVCCRATRTWNEVANEYEQVGKTRAAGTAWTEAGNYWLFGTATYRQGDLVSADKLERDARRFFNALDRAVLPRVAVKAGIRLQRHVYVELGRYRRNRHKHFFIKGRPWHDHSLICRHAERLWLKTAAGARDVTLEDCLQPNNRRSGYGWKEYGQLADSTLLASCCER